MENAKTILAQSPSHTSIPGQISKVGGYKLNTSRVDWFASFKPVEGAMEALSAFRELASGKVLWRMLLCYGSVGCGKSHLLEALAFSLGYRVTTKWPEAVRWLKRSMNPDPEWGIVAYDTNFKSLQERSVLLLDDVGSGASSTDWAWRELEDIIDYRYERNLLTVITTNLKWEQIPDRIVSRFRDGEKSRLVLNSATDFRPLKGKR